MTNNTNHTPTPPAGEAEVAQPAENETITKMQAEIGELRSQLRAASTRAAIVEKLRAAGARSPELLVAAAAERLQFADDGSAGNAAAVVDALRSEMPEQFAAPASASQIDAGSGVAAAPRPLTREALAKMSPEQIARLDWSAVRQVLSQS